MLAHEFQHAVLRHSLQRMVRAAGLQAVLALLVGDLEGLGGVIRNAGLQIQELSYGRDQEREADLAAIDLLARAGIDPAGPPGLLRPARGDGRRAGRRGRREGALAALHAPGERGAQRGAPGGHRAARPRPVRAAGGPVSRAEVGNAVPFDASADELVRRRRSCRRYLERPLAEQARRSLEAFLAENRRGPFGGRTRFALVAATAEDRAALKGLGHLRLHPRRGRLHRRRGRARPQGPRGLRLRDGARDPAGDRPGARHLLARRHVHEEPLRAEGSGSPRDELMPAVAAVGYARDGSFAAGPHPPDGGVELPPAAGGAVLRRRLRHAPRPGRRRRATPRRSSWSAGPRRPPTGSRGGSSGRRPAGTSTWRGPRATARAPCCSPCCGSPTCSAWTWASRCATSSWPPARPDWRAPG